MSSRPLILPLTLLMAGACVALAPRVADAARGKAVTIKKLSIAPTSFSSAGGNVTVKVKVTAKDATITSVRGQSQFPGRGGPIVTLNSAGGGVYTGIVRVQPNYSTQAQRGKLMLYVATSGRSLEKSIANLKLGKGNDSLPPPPPN